MTFFTKVRDLVSFRAMPEPPPSAPALATLQPSYAIGRAQWPNVATREYVDAYYKKSGLIFRCVNVLADAVAEAPLKVYEEGNGGLVEQPEHPLRQLLRQPNPAMSESEFHVFTATLMAIAGYAAIQKVRAGAGNVVQLWHFRPDWLKPIPRDGAAPDWQYRVPGHDPITIPASEIVIIPFRTDPGFGFTGVSPLAEILREAAIDTAATDFIKLMFDHGGTPPIVLKNSGPLTGSVQQQQAQAQAMREMWQQMFGGWQNWAKPPYLNQTDVQVVGFSPNDLSYPDLRALSEVRIAQAFGIPPIIIGAQAGLNAATYSNFEQAMRTLQLHSANPLRARIDGALTRGLIPEFDRTGLLSLEFDTDNIAALAPDEDAVHNRLGQDFLRGFLKLNDVRQALGFEPIAGKLGDAFILPRGSAFIDETGEMIATASGAGNVSAITGGEVQKGAPAASGTGDGGKKSALPPGDHGAWAIYALPADLSTAIMAEPDPAGEQRADARARELGGVRLPPEQRAKTVAAAHGTVTRLANAHKSALVAYWKMQGRRVVNAVVYQRGFDYNHPAIMAKYDGGWQVVDSAESRDFATKSLVTMGNIDWQEESATLLLLLTELWQDAGRQAFAQIANDLHLALPFDANAPAVHAFLSQVAQRAQMITDTTQHDVEQTVNEQLSQGTTPAALTAALIALFDGYGDSRAQTVATTEAHQSYGRATTVGYAASGQVAAAELFDNPDHDTDPMPPTDTTCADRNGLVVPLEQVDAYFDSSHVNCILTSLPVPMTGDGA